MSFLSNKINFDDSIEPSIELFNCEEEIKSFWINLLDFLKSFLSQNILTWIESLSNKGFWRNLMMLNLQIDDFPWDSMKYLNFDSTWIFDDFEFQFYGRPSDPEAFSKLRRF